MNIRPYLAAAAVLGILGPAHAAQQQSRAPVVVTAKALTVGEWSARTAKSLKNHLRYPAYLLGRTPNEGIVKVRFQCSESGAPAAAVIADSSGYRELDKAALHAVNGVRTLHPLPDGITHDQQFQAVILFARGQNQSDRANALRDDAARQNARFSPGGAPLMATVAVIPVG